jgi:uncharacterized protein (TIGR03000 family)
MYSIVLMVAMSHGAAAPGWQSGEVDLRGTNFIHATAHQHYRHGCHGCHGCYGGGCYGGGCYGGGCYGGGCYGGCYGGGCWGGGCYGGYRGYGCYGGGCWGGGCYGGYAYGGYGGGYGGYASYAMPYGGYAGMPAYGGYTSGYYNPGMPGAAAPVTTPSGPGVAPVDQGGRGAEGDRGRRGTGEEGTSKDRESLGPMPATLIVDLPAGAQLKVDDYTTRSTAATRTFVTPPLTPGQEYHYMLTGEIRRGNEPVTVRKQVTVRPGEETRVTLEFPTADVVQK